MWESINLQQWNNSFKGINGLIFEKCWIFEKWIKNDKKSIYGDRCK